MTDEIIYGLRVNIETAQLLVRKGQSCPEHNKPIHVVTTFQDKDPDPKCIDCLIDLFTSLVDLAVEATAQTFVDSG